LPYPSFCSRRRLNLPERKQQTVKHVHDLFDLGLFTPHLVDVAGMLCSHRGLNLRRQE
jgi:hypothetical protein